MITIRKRLDEERTRILERFGIFNGVVPFDTIKITFPRPYLMRAALWFKGNELVFFDTPAPRPNNVVELTGLEGATHFNTFNAKTTNLPTPEESSESRLHSED